MSVIDTIQGVLAKDPTNHNSKHIINELQSQLAFSVDVTANNVADLSSLFSEQQTKDVSKAVIDKAKEVANEHAFGSSGTDEGLRTLSSFLHCIRFLLRDRTHTDELRTPQHVMFYVKLVDATKDIPGCDVSTEAMTCVVNSTFENEPVAMELFKNGIVDKTLGVLRDGGNVQLLLSSCRVLSLMVGQLLSKQKEIVQHLLKGSIVNILSSLLAFALHSPLGESGAWTQCASLILEVLKLLFALGSELDQENIKTNDAQDGTSMTQLGMLLVELVLLPDELPFSYQIKSLVVHVLLYMPEGYTHFLTANNAMDPLLELLDNKARRALQMKEKSPDVIVAPLLMVLKTSCEQSIRAREECDQMVFPPSKSVEAKVDLEPSVESKGSTPTNKMAPEDAPRGTLRQLLISSMSTSNVALQSCVNDFLYNVCAKDTDLFIKRTGLGNSLGHLQRLGLFSPQQ